VFERYKRMTRNVEEAVLEMYLSGISTRKIDGTTDVLSRVKIGSLGRIMPQRVYSERYMTLLCCPGYTAT
jgi:hypothetical protein